MSVKGYCTSNTETLAASMYQSTRHNPAIDFSTSRQSPYYWSITTSLVVIAHSILDSTMRLYSITCDFSPNHTFSTGHASIKVLYRPIQQCQPRTERTMPRAAAHRSAILFCPWSGIGKSRGIRLAKRRSRHQHVSTYIRTSWDSNSK